MRLTARTSVSGILLVWALGLHAAFFVSAGALWRDEANSAAQASLPSWSGIWQSLAHDSFPAGYAALLRLWCAHPWNASDTGLRVFGLATGMLLVATFWGAARLLGCRPLVVLALAAADPLVVTEGDSIRPHGLGLACLVWTFALCGRVAEGGGLAWLAAAAAAAVLSVQLVYTSALYVALFSLAAVLVARGGRARALVPGAAAALSLVPYARVLARMREWADVVHYRVDWLSFLRGVATEHAMDLILVAAAWTGVVAWGLRPRRAPLRGLSLYSAVVAALALPIQVAFLEAAGAPPFPRYFLPAVALLALGSERALEERSARLRTAAALVILLASAWPAWSWVRLRRTNVDQVARALGGRAQPADLVVVSPWFLHPSFQRYYRGPAPWITIPELPRDPMTRYLWVKRAMREDDSGERLREHLESVLARGGSLWYVSQRLPETMPAVPRPTPPGAVLRGEDYARFRAFWESDIGARLLACCRFEVTIAPGPEPGWREESLFLTRWERPSKR